MNYNLIGVEVGQLLGAHLTLLGHCPAETEINQALR